MEADVDTIDIDGNIKGYKFHNVTKYYENDIVFIAHEDKHINLLPIELLEHVEGCIVYFDSENVSANYCNFQLPLFCNLFVLCIPERVPEKNAGVCEFHRVE